MFNKRGAMEMSIGTIVVIVLSMSMLIFGMILLKNIFTGAGDVVDMTNEQIKSQVGKLFGEDKKLVVFPDTRRIEVKQGDISGFGIGIKNLLQGASEDKFSYEVVVSDPDVKVKCGVSESEILGWITIGRAESNIALGPGEFTSGRVLLRIPEGSSLCDFRLRVNVKHGSNAYASEFMDVTIKA
ncbi:MAG: hypothetical protein IH845_01435 [Nanoarchaeota archaeon]|nr:hypothetical protein [Nanoarchaeota archaeon]